LEKQSVEDVLKQGIHGPLETKPDERRKFLGTIRERIIVALTKKQVEEEGIYTEVEKYMKEYKKARLLLNGMMEYSYLSKYMRLASKYKIVHTIVTNKEHESEIGLILAMDYAIDKEEIYLKKNVQIQNEPKKSLFSKIFKRKG
jgi:uncharacterized protein YueI